VFFDQRYNASTWLPLGEYVMEPGLGHKIVLSNDSLDGLMAADAIRFEVIDDLPAVVADAIKLVSNDGEDLTYVHADHLGAPQKMTDKDRSVVWDVSFLPFGEEDSIIGSAANDNRFPGQRLSSETGLHYNYFRDYDPTTGRYLQSDPIGLAGGINTYGYVSGNPVNYTDPEGLWSPEAHDALILHAFGNLLPRSDIDKLKKFGREFDKNTQGSKQSHMHSMRSSGQDVQEAINKRDQFINELLERICDVGEDRDEQLRLFSHAIHPIMDKYSPEHRDSNGNPKEWKMWWPFGHSPNESIGNETAKHITPSIRNKVTKELRKAYKKAF